MRKIKVAVIGCGTIANSAHIPSYLNNDKAEIKYFCDIIPERAKAAVEKYGCGEAIEDYMTALNDPEIEAVSVCTPNNCHSTIAIAALEHGKNVLCEKPAARTYEEALAMQQAHNKSGKVLNIGVVNRFDFAVNQIKTLIEQGALGDVFHVYASFRSHRSIPGIGGDFTKKSVAGGGVLIDWGVHFLDIIMYCCGDPAPKSVSSEAFSKLGTKIDDYAYVNMWAGPPKLDGTYDVEDSITGIVRTEGPVISFQGAWAQNIGEDEMYIDFMGDKGGIRLHYGSDFVFYGVNNGMLSQTTYKFPAMNKFQNEIDSFLDCIDSKEVLPSNINTVIITAKLMDAIYRSSESHQEIEL